MHTWWCWYLDNIENQCPSSFTPPGPFKRATRQASSMVQSSRSRALLAVFLGCPALYNRCMCIPGGASTTTTSNISDGHRSHLPDHSNAQPGSLTSDGRWCSHRGLMRRGLYSLGCFWLYNRCMCTYSGGSTQDPTTTRSRRRSHLSDRSTAYDNKKR